MRQEQSLEFSNLFYIDLKGRHRNLLSLGAIEDDSQVSFEKRRLSLEPENNDRFFQLQRRTGGHPKRLYREYMTYSDSDEYIPIEMDVFMDFFERKEAQLKRIVNEKHSSAEAWMDLLHHQIKSNSSSKEFDERMDAIFTKAFDNTRDERVFTLWMRYLFCKGYQQEAFHRWEEYLGKNMASISSWNEFTDIAQHLPTMHQIRVFLKRALGVTRRINQTHASSLVVFKCVQFEISSGNMELGYSLALAFIELNASSPLGIEGIHRNWGRNCFNILFFHNGTVRDVPKASEWAEAEMAVDMENLLPHTLDSEVVDSIVGFDRVSPFLVTVSSADILWFTLHFICVLGIPQELVTEIFTDFIPLSSTFSCQNTPASLASIAASHETWSDDLFETLKYTLVLRILDQFSSTDHRYLHLKMALETIRNENDGLCLSKKVLADHPEDISLYCFYASLLSAIGRHEKAIKVFHSISNVCNASQRPLVSLGYMYALLQSFRSFQEDGRKILEMLLTVGSDRKLSLGSLAIEVVSARTRIRELIKGTSLSMQSNQLTYTLLLCWLELFVNISSASISFESIQKVISPIAANTTPLEYSTGLWLYRHILRILYFHANLFENWGYLHAWLQSIIPRYPSHLEFITAYLSATEKLDTISRISSTPIPVLSSPMTSSVTLFYINFFIQSNASPSRIRFHFESVFGTTESSEPVQSLRTSPELWLAYISFERTHGTPDSVGKLFYRAIHCCPLSRDLWVTGLYYISQLIGTTEFIQLLHTMQSIDIRIVNDFIL